LRGVFLHSERKTIEGGLLPGLKGESTSKKLGKERRGLRNK